MVTLHLRCRVPRAQRAEFIEFLRTATPYYEAPGGIRVRLLERRVDGADIVEFIEAIEYESEAAYLADQIRVDRDPRMRELLARWRTLLADDAVVEAYVDETARLTRR